MISISFVKGMLDESIKYVVDNKDMYVQNPGKDFTRKRKCSMQGIIKSIIAMSNSTISKEIAEYNLRNSYNNITTSAFVQNQQKIKPEAFEQILKLFSNQLLSPKTYKGHMLYAVDGTTINVAHNPNDKDTYLKAVKEGRGYNQVHCTALYDVENDRYVDAVIQGKNKQNEHSALCQMVNEYVFKRPSIIVLDRGYQSFNDIATLDAKENLDYVIRVNQVNGAIREIKALPMMELDIIISLEVTTSQTKEDEEKGRHFIPTHRNPDFQYSEKTGNSAWNFPSPYRLTFRVVRFEINPGQYETLITSLDKKDFSIADMKELYHMRWGIEVSFRYLKHPCGVSYLHNKKLELNYQEIYAAMIIYNYCRYLESSIVVHKRRSTKYQYKISVTTAIKLFRDDLKYNYDPQKLIAILSKNSEPIRPGRHDERKMKFKSFGYFTYRAA